MVETFCPFCEKKIVCESDFLNEVYEKDKDVRRHNMATLVFHHKHVHQADFRAQLLADGKKVNESMGNYWALLRLIPAIFYSKEISSLSKKKLFEAIDRLPGIWQKEVALEKRDDYLQKLQRPRRRPRPRQRRY